MLATYFPRISVPAHSSEVQWVSLYIAKKMHGPFVTELLQTSTGNADCIIRSVALLFPMKLHAIEWDQKGTFAYDSYAIIPFRRIMSNACAWHKCYFMSQVKLGENCWHTCKIIGEAGTYWPNPTFQIVADDNAEPILAKSATGAWAGILSRIKANILARQATLS